MNDLKTLIVDDEAPARAKLKRYLNECEGFTLVGEAEDGPQALAAILRQTPDLVLLDVQMPGLTGFDVLRLLPEEQRPRIVFTTAYDQYAVDAFELSAVDYLLKPIGKTRFNEALARCRKLGPPGDTTSLLNNLQGEGFATRLPLHSRNRIVLMGVDQLAYVRTEQKIVAIYTHDHTRYWSNETLDNLERRLNPERFFRIHRSALINLDGVFEIEPHSDGRLKVHFQDGPTLSVAREPARKLRTRLGF